LDEGVDDREESMSYSSFLRAAGLGARALVAACLLTCLLAWLAPAARALLSVEADVTPTGLGSYLYEVMVTNALAFDVVLINLVDRLGPTSRAADVLAWVHYKRGDTPRADRLIHQALERGPSQADTLYRAGMIHLALGRSEAGRLYLHRALSLNPTFHPIHAAEAATILGASCLP